MGRRASTIDANHCCTAQELAFRFALWAMGLAEVPSPDRIRVRYGVSRATAFRWRRAWCDANGIAPPLRQSARKLTPAEVMRAKKASTGLRRVIRRSDDACRSCEFFRYREGARWGLCTNHKFRTQTSHVCNSHVPA
jgi:transposase-like protein